MTFIQTRGEFNCNPLNINYVPANKWEGQLGIEQPREGGEPARFARFTSAVFGIRAGARLLERYIQRGENTVPKIVAAWAPGSDNNNDNAYEASVLKSTGWDATTEVELTAADLCALIAAMITVENGRNIYAPQIIAEAVQMALS